MAERAARHLAGRRAKKDALGMRESLEEVLGIDLRDIEKAIAPPPDERP